jgi:16S rRNA A1518/A1519 N6-dimethyltransferase RsmA/KsgA/DIM1 with predicted DNA glycosylase/AP lyase activity
VNGKGLTLVEIEPAFCKMLAEKFPEATSVNQDVRSLDFSTVGTGLHVFGNIPHVFSTDIVFHLLESRKHDVERVLLKDVLASALEQAGLSSDLRAERLSVAEFGRLASFLPDKPSKSGGDTRPET